MSLAEILIYHYFYETRYILIIILGETCEYFSDKQQLGRRSNLEWGLLFSSILQSCELDPIGWALAPTLKVRWTDKHHYVSQFSSL